MVFRTLLKTAAAVIALSAATANSATITLIDEGGVAGSAAERGFKAAASYWGSIISTNVAINIGVRYSSAGFTNSSIIGQTDSTLQVLTTSAWESYILSSRSTSTLDGQMVMPNLTRGAYAAIVNAPYDGATNTGIDTGAWRYDAEVGGANSFNNKNLDANTALVKALGGTANYGGNPAIDGRIAFNSAFAFDYDPSDGIAADKIDFVGVAIHELAHALGFTSGVDTYDQFAHGTGPLAGAGDARNFDRLAVATAMDMFRYSTDPNGIVPGIDSVLDLSIGTASYFSIDGGATALFGNRFATGQYGGDGFQAQHWADTSNCADGLGLMDPTLCAGQMGVVRALDLSVMDAIGYNLTIDTMAAPTYARTTAQIFSDFASTPEPATWAMMAGGFGAVGAGLRRRGRASSRAV